MPKPYVPTKAIDLPNVSLSQVLSRGRDEEGKN
jgi:hypothetical protein